MPLGNPIRKQNESRMVSVLATEGQTVFTVQGGYIINHISVFRNGVRLSNAEDFTAGDGSTVTLNNAANVDDRIEFHVFDRFTVQNAIVSAASTQTINGDVVVNGKIFGNLDVPSINTGIVTATELDLNGKGDISGDLKVTGVSTFVGNVNIGGGNIVLGDSDGASDDRIQIGAGTDLSLYHNGASSYIDNTGGSLFIKSSNQVYIQDDQGRKQITCVDGAAVELYHAGVDSVRLQTTTTGVSVPTLNVTGISTFASDVSISDTIVHTGDTNTKIRFPSADTFTVETGGSERIRVDSSGSVGINETTPDSKVDILYSSSTDGTTQKLIHLRTDPGAGYVSRGLFVKIGRDGNYDNSAAHYDIVGSSGNSGTHIFEVEGSEKLRMTKDGKIGMGTDMAGTPASSYGFGVYRASGTGYLYTETAQSSASAGLRAKAGAADFTIFTTEGTGQLSIYDNTNTDERVRLTSAGTVNIGNSLTQTSRLFTVENTLADGGEIAYIGNNDGASNYGGLVISAGETDRECRLESAWGNSFMTFYTNGGSATEKMRLTSGGRLGLGVASPDELLHLKSTASAGACIELDNNNNYKSQIKTSSDAMEIRAPQAMNFYTGNNDGASSTIRMALKNTGGLEHYSSSNAVQNLKFRSSDVNWHGYLNQTVAGGTIATIIANSGQWTVDGTTYAATKDYNGAFSTGAFIIHNQYNSSAGNATFTFKSKANGSSTTDGAISHYYTMNQSGQHYWGDNAATIGNQDSNKFVFSGTKAYSGGIVQQQVAVVDASAYNTTDNGGVIAFQAKYNSSGNYTQMASCGGLKANNSNGNYEGRFQIKVRNHNGNSIEYVDIGPTRSRFLNSLTTESELNLIRASGTPSSKYMDIGYLNNAFYIRRTNGGDGGHTVHCTFNSNGVISGNFNDTSDAKLKENIASVSDGSLALVKQLRPVTFDWKDSTKSNDQTGFIAQEVKAIIPNIVNGEEYDETKVNEKGQIISTGYSINTTGVVAHLTKALQELSAKNDALEARIAALEGS